MFERHKDYRCRDFPTKPSTINAPGDMCLDKDRMMLMAFNGVSWRDMEDATADSLSNLKFYRVDKNVYRIQDRMFMFLIDYKLESLGICNFHRYDKGPNGENRMNHANHWYYYFPDKVDLSMFIVLFPAEKF